MHLIYEVVEFVGRRSMIDVFVIAILSALVRMGRLMSVYPAPGALLFAIANIFNVGTIILATKITSATGHDPSLHSRITPAMMFEGYCEPSVSVTMIGIIFEEI